MGFYFYYTRTEEGKQYPIYCRKLVTLEKKEEVLLDQNELAKGFKFFSIGAFAVSDNGNMLAYSTDTTGYRQYKLYIKNLKTGQLLPETFERTGNVLWSTDNKTLFFTTEDAVTKRSDKFMRHLIGTDVANEVFHEKDELFDVTAYRSRDKEIISLAQSVKPPMSFTSFAADEPSPEGKELLDASLITNTTLTFIARISISGPTRERKTSAW